MSDPVTINFRASIKLDWDRDVLDAGREGELEQAVQNIVGSAGVVVELAELHRPNGARAGYQAKYYEACAELKRIVHKQAALKREVNRLREATDDLRHKQLRNAAQHYKKALSQIAYAPNPDDPVAIARNALKREWVAILGATESIPEQSP